MDPQVAKILEDACSRVRVPAGGDKIHKDECVYSFDTPESPTGLYLCLRTFLGFGESFVEQHFTRTGSNADPPEKKVTKMAIGIEGGFHAGKSPKVEYKEQHSLVLRDVVKKALEMESASKLSELEALAGTWDGEARQISKNAENLTQLDNGIRIPPSGWKCEKCDKTENLWLNLTDGSILCGRKFFDGSGGNNHAVEHYEQSRHPLAVKLGTITSDSKADVFDYQLDDMVEDPWLAKHLAHFGINIHSMEKTEKTMTELEIEINQKMEWSVLTESGADLKPLYGPGYTGLQNLGNSCYLSSVMQVVFTIPEFLAKFVEQSNDIFARGSVDPFDDFNVQMAKLGTGMSSGRYSVPLRDTLTDAGKGNGGPDFEKKLDEMKWQQGIPPRSFKALIGKGHPEFSTKHQQDASEFVLHLINLVEKFTFLTFLCGTKQRHSRIPTNPADCFKFKVEDRVQCQASGKVSYKYRTEYLLPLSVPMSAAWNKEEVAAYESKKAEYEQKKMCMDPSLVVRPAIRVEDCLSSFVASERVDRFFSTAIQNYTSAEKTTRLTTFPRYLFIQLKKFSLAPDWTPIKLDVSVGMPDELNLEALRGFGLRKGEEKLPEAKSKPKVDLNEEHIQHLVSMGFPMEACKKAVYHTGNQGVEAAMNWVMEHMADDDFGSPFVIPGTESSADEFVPEANAMMMLTSMGFTDDQAKLALKSTNNNLERAADWIFSHRDELEALVAAAKGEAAKGHYKLVAFISHMGSSAFVGHYVCHIFKEGRWVIFNDEKVAVSEHPPKDLGYLYLYERS
ncbi:unnamed protein product [Notodromas monacha]|uniref:Ubiquitin carboxyl-terminal hydrolase n=1 Tax=Notodromas monacha TaxID=399045 RepID=A0A7R9BJG2_9CRUS|nr:unnamed protein product [Notodromas monacha]CAG0915767.1 unnamed protein product [Notodromas monacha]